MKNLLKRFFSTTKSHKLIVSIVGKPNVGKSTLFNKLSLSNRSLVHPTPGLTRDCLDITVYKTLEIPIELRDTPGIQYLENKRERSNFDTYVTQVNKNTYTTAQYDVMAEQMLIRTKESIEESDCVLFLVDGKNGISEQDMCISRWLKTQFPNKPTFMLANKIDTEKIELESYNDVYSLGFKDPKFISAETGQSLHAVWEIIQSFVTDDHLKAYKQKIVDRKNKIQTFKKEFLEECKSLKESSKRVKIDMTEVSREYDFLNRDLYLLSDLDNDAIPLSNLILSPKINDISSLTYYNKYKNLPIRIALFGRPNSGKSTFFNNILKKEKSLIHHMAHTTKDPVESRLIYKGRRIDLIDTAGIDKQLIRDPKDADYGVFYRNLEVLREAQVHIIVVDAMNAFRVKDMDMIHRSTKEGRGIILLVNKWDLVDPKWHQKAIKYMKEQVKSSFPGENSCPMIFGSALTGTGIENILDSALGVYENWNLRISTSLLNNWLNKFKKLTSNDYESLVKRQQVLRIRFISQIKTRPPTFAIFVNDKTKFKPHIFKFVKNKLAEEFKIFGVGIKTVIKQCDKMDFRRRMQRLIKG